MLPGPPMQQSRYDVVVSLDTATRRRALERQVAHTQPAGPPARIVRLPRARTWGLADLWPFALFYGVPVGAAWWLAGASPALALAALLLGSTGAVIGACALWSVCSDVLADTGHAIGRHLTWWGFVALLYPAIALEWLLRRALKIYDTLREHAASCLCAAFLGCIAASVGLLIPLIALTAAACAYVLLRGPLARQSRAIRERAARARRKRLKKRAEQRRRVREFVEAVHAAHAERLAQHSRERRAWERVTTMHLEWEGEELLTVTRVPEPTYHVQAVTLTEGITYSLVGAASLTLFGIYLTRFF